MEGKIMTGDHILTFMLEAPPTEKFSHGHVRLLWNGVDNVITGDTLVSLP